MDDIKTEVAIQLRDESGRYLSTAQAVSGIQVARACFRLWYRTGEPVVSIALAGTKTYKVPSQQEGEPQGAKTSRGENFKGRKPQGAEYRCEAQGRTVP